MISVDYRIGSGELSKYFLPYGITPNRTKLDFGDFCFEGNGPDGKVAVGIERKRIEDLIDSMTSKRLSGHQLLGMCDIYDYGYLIVEGIYRPGENGQILISNGGTSWSSKATPYRAIDNYLSTLELRGGLMIRRTGRPDETVCVVVDLYRYWTDKLWSEHRSHDEIYAPGADRNPPSRRLRMTKRVLTPREKLSENIACQLPGIDRRARDVAKFFGHSSRRIVNADIGLWLKFGLGKGTAEKIVGAVD